MLRGQGLGVRAIARARGRTPSTISRELRRNAATRGGQPRLSGVDRAAVEGRACSPGAPRRRSWPPRSGCVPTSRPGSRGRSPGPTGSRFPARWCVSSVAVTGVGRTGGGPRRGVAGADREPGRQLDFPEDATMRISHEAIIRLVRPGPRRAQRGVVLGVLEHHPDRTLPHFRREPTRSGHGSHPLKEWSLRDTRGGSGWCQSDRKDFPPNWTWERYRQYLVSVGVKDPVFVGGDYCALGKKYCRCLRRHPRRECRRNPLLSNGQQRMTGRRNRVICSA